ncbi:MAG: MATE family efflux transporter [Clostridia bacterium]|nr:MATE family efflux transporter [Clostridia bacterium]
MVERIKPKRNFTEGPLFFRIILFALPIIAMGMLQIFYNMADSIVVGRYSGDDVALAAVGSTGALTNLIVNFLLGIAAGTNVVLSQCYGAKDNERVESTVHTSMAFSVIGGLLFMAIGLIVARPALILMDTKPEVLDKAVLYITIICLGIPASSVYNFGASILRSIGDSKTPLFALASTGLVNVLLNLVFVIKFNMSVEGVAIATIVSQYLSAAWVVIVLLCKRGENYRLYLRKLRIDTKVLSRILRYGVPTGIQSSFFSISNVILSSAVNTFPTTTVSAKTIATNIDGISYTAMNSFSKASMTFVGQNYGAKKYDRVKKSVWYCLIQVVVLGVIITQTELLFGRELANLFVDSSMADAEVVVNEALEIMKVVLTTYFLCGIMEVLSSAVRGMGYSISSMIISLIGACFFRIFWVEVLFYNIESMQNIRGLFMVYPVSWIFTIAMQLVLLSFAFRSMGKAKTNAENSVTVK